MATDNLSKIDANLVYDELFNDEVIYVVDKNFKVVFASKGAIELYQKINSKPDGPLGKMCYHAFKMKGNQCEMCKMVFSQDSITEENYIHLLERTVKFPYHELEIKQFNNNGDTYLIHRLINFELSDWMGEYSQRIVDTSKESIVVTDLGGNILSVNPTFEYKMGYKGSEVVGKSNKIFYYDESVAEEITKKIIEKGKIENYPITVRTKNGLLRDVGLTAWIVNKGDNKVIVRVSKFLDKAQVLRSVITITESILKAYESMSLTSEIVRQTAQLLDSKFCALYLVSEDGTKLVLKAAYDQEYMESIKNITYDLNWNAKYEYEIDGITALVAIKKRPFEANSRNDIINHPSHKGKLDLVYSNDRDFKNMYSIPLIMDNNVLGVFKIEYKIDGDEYNIIDKQIFELMGKYIMLVLEQRKKLQKTVLEHIAHMTRAPISEAIMNLSLLEDKGILERMSKSEFSETVRIIKNALLQANITATNLIALSVDTRESHNLPIVSVDMKKFINKITNSFEAFIKNVRFNADVEGNILLSEHRQIKLEIILQNILHNSIKYSKHTKLMEDIDISGKKEMHYYKIKIRDYGVGMSSKDLDNIFTDFFKGDSSKVNREKYGSVRGLGIGLSSIKKICTEMGWYCEIHSEKDHGTTFALKIPIGD